jgi:hypothetical protein
VCEGLSPAQGAPLAPRIHHIVGCQTAARIAEASVSVLGHFGRSRFHRKDRRAEVREFGVCASARGLQTRLLLLNLGGIFFNSGLRIEKCVLCLPPTFCPSDLPVKNLGGSRHELSARQQPEAVARLGLATPREFLQEGCGAAAKDDDSPERLPRLPGAAAPPHFSSICRTDHWGRLR